jgi:hypothetical protein
MAVEIVPGKHCDFSTYLAKSARAHSGAWAEVQFPVLWNRVVVPWQKKLFHYSTVISAPILPSDRELSLSRAQRCSFLITEQCCGPKAVEMVQPKTAISASTLPREQALNLAHAQRFSFLIMEKSCGPLAVEIIPGNTAISAPILPRERELSLAHAHRCSFLIM